MRGFVVLLFRILLTYNNVETCKSFGRIKKPDFTHKILSVELAFEGLRWHDLRRWNIAGEKKYKEKTVIDFDRGANGKPINLKERIVVTRVFDKKHNWLPLPVNQVNLYPAFGQNPGW